ncbi:hypothetical protein NDJ13_17105 [Vibrio alginolyticus]|uniref:hypothetical protein n=1 Tax=Vibrio TaxID=662 RepID=UPI00211A763D|nr:MULTISPECIES: hypothetical protein [Vibrio]MCQ9069789.1 hypothetical protein [Vibrio alginolyticus]MCS0140132.1 hypothetical protein [Vibrio alginolyticus]MDW2262951.1 hypothetical protein [Vibrio sp. 1557]
MRLKTMHTIWLTLFTSLVLLVSSVVNSAPMMNMQMMSNNQMTQHPSMMDEQDCDMPEMKDHIMASPVEKNSSKINCNGGSGMVHTCCTAACTIVFVPLPIPVNRTSPNVYRAPITPDVLSPIVHVSRDLYRPPIA